METGNIESAMALLRRLVRGSLRCGLAIGALLRDLARMVGIASEPETPSFRPSHERLVASILLLDAMARDRGAEITARSILAALFLADKEHLDLHDRPVVYDNYAAEEQGPVGIEAKAMLSAEYEWSDDGAGAPWGISERLGGADAALSPRREANRRVLSRSDVQVLTAALDAVLELGDASLAHLTRRNRAYVAAWRNGAGKGASLDPRLIPERRDDEMMEDLLHASRYLA